MDHLFRHHYGKMVSTLTRIFGLAHLETIEDAVQDTFIQALKTWRKQWPENPEAWLTRAAKNRTIDLFRKINAETERATKFYQGAAAMSISELFLDDEIEDSQLRMIFTACHPSLDARDQITFALKTISGFSIKEIAAALLTKEDTIKKRLTRARKNIVSNQLSFEIPDTSQLPQRIHRVQEVLYLIFNEGFHSIKKDKIIRKDLCSEAMRLVKLILKKEKLRTPSTYALLALMCFHAARIEGKVNADNEIIDLRNQDRSKWSFQLISVANGLMNKAVENCLAYSTYHYEAAIAFEHVRATSFEETNWKSILNWYERLNASYPSATTKLNMAIVHLQLGQEKECKSILDGMEPKDLGQREYLYYGTMAEYYHSVNDQTSARSSLRTAIDLCKNEIEKKFLFSKLERM